MCLKILNSTNILTNMTDNFIIWVQNRYKVKYLFNIQLEISYLCHVFKETQGERKEEDLKIIDQKIVESHFQKQKSPRTRHASRPFDFFLYNRKKLYGVLRKKY